MIGVTDSNGATPLHVAAYASFLDAGDSLKSMLARVSAPSDAQAAAGSGADDVERAQRTISSTNPIVTRGQTSDGVF